MRMDESAINGGVGLRKEIFAWFGAAAYAANCLEVELISLILLTARLKGSLLTVDNHYALDALLRRKTLGILIQEVKKHITLGEGFEETLGEALEKRNYLAHHFFYKHSTDLLSPEGCGKMLDELKKLHNSFKEADQVAETIHRLMRRLAGWSENDMQTEVDRFVGRHMKW